MNIKDDNYKRVLIISGYNLTSDSATDITLRSYFKHWPKNRLMILTTTSNQKPFTRTVTLKSSFLSQIRILFINLLLKNNKGIVKKNIIPSTLTNNPNKSVKKRQKIFTLGAAYIDLINFRISKNLKNELDDFKPEIIYTIMGNIRIIRIANALAKEYKISIVPHFMDDWISTMYTGSFFLKFPRKVLLSSLKNLLLYTKFGLCISEKMCREYEQRFHKKFTSLMNIINVEKFNNINKTKINTNVNKTRKKVFTYLGGLHLNRWKSLHLLSNVLASISKEMDNELILEIYTNENDIKMYSFKFNIDNTVFKKFVNHDIALQKMAQTNFLIHVESFDEPVISYTRLSISTKIPEYLASGTPICAIGPANLASIEYLLDNNCAYVVTSNDYLTLKNTIVSAINGDNNNLYKKNSESLFYTNHSDKKIESFIKLLSI